MEVTGNRRKGEMEVTGNSRKGEIEIHEEEQRRENRIKMNQKAPKLKRGQIQCKPENSEIGILLLDSSYDFKQSNKQGTQQLCSVHRPISLNQ